MPELPDITIYIEQLRSRIAGKELERVRIVSPFLLRSFDPPIAGAAKKTVTGIHRIGKQIAIELEGELFLVIHLMIAGRFHWKRPGAKIGGKMQLAAFDFPHGTLTLTEAGTKKRAALHLVRGKKALASFDRGGVDILSASFDEFRGALHRENHTLKRALTDQRLFSGIGNAYSDEILHRAGLSPLQLTRNLADPESRGLFDATQTVMKEWIDRLRSETGNDFPEKVTAFRPEMAVHGKFKKPCPVCGTPVQRIVYAENECNYCPRCQTGGKLLADRSLSRLLKDDWPRTIEELENAVQTSISQSPLLTILMFLFLSLATPLFSQPLDLRFDHFTTENGLSQDVVKCLHRDKLGYLWIGTEDGLNRYDGYAIKSYKLVPEKGKELPNNTVSGIDDVDEDNLLVAMGGNLVLYDRARDTLERPSGALSTYSTSQITSIIHDRRGVTWFICENSSLVRYDPAHDSCRSWSFAESATEAPFRKGIVTLFIDSYDSLWVGTESALALLHGNAGEFEYFPLRNVQHDRPRYLFPSAITEDVAHDLWIGTQTGAYRFDRGRRAFRLVSFGGEGSDFPAQHDYIIGGFEWDKSGRLWMGGFSGLYCFDPRTGKGASYTQIENDRTSLLNSRIYALYCDPSNVLWVGTWHGGLNRVDFKEERFGFLRNSVSTPLAGHASDIIAVCEDTAGNTWLASRAGGVTRIDRRTGAFTAFVHDRRKSSGIGGGEHSSIAPDGDGSVWFASSSELEHYDQHKGTFSRIRVPGVDGKKKIILKIYNDTRGRLWIGVENFGAVCLEKSTGKFTTYNASSADTVWRGFTGCWAFYEDGEGNIWLGGWIGSLDLYCIQRSANRVTRYSQRQLNTARSMAEDRDGNVWIGTWGQGLSRLNPRTGDVRQFTELDGLANNFVKGLVIDRTGDLWISTEMGISRYSPSAGTFKNFDFHDGLQGNFFYTSSCWEGKNGTVYFGGVNGLNAFDPQNIRDEGYDPPVILTDFKVLDRNRREDRPLSRLTRARLSSSEDMFSFEYASLDLTAPERNRYRYMLQGFDREWIDAGERRYASYTHLDPGEYLFQVKGTNSDGRWSTHIAELRIVVLPAFWQTWWFYGALAFVTGAALYGFYRYRLNKFLELEQTRAAIATDLHDDIGATLTSIALFSDLARNEVSSDVPQAIGRLQRIAETSRSLLDRMNDIVWAINPENDSLEFLLLRMKEIATSLFDARGIEYEITVPGSLPEVKLPMTVRRNLFLVYKEIVHNVVRHSSATAVNIRVTFPGEPGSHFEVDVRDNGSGFDAAQVKRGNGLNNITQRSHLLHADLEFISAPGKGTTVRLRFPFKSPH